MGQISTLKRTIPLAFGISCIGFVFCLFALASLGFIIQLEINEAYFYIASAVSISLSIRILGGGRQKDRWLGKDLLLTICLLCVVFTISLLLSANLLDSSYDGRSYHQIGVYYLGSGWNPIFQKMSEVVALTPFLSHEIWVEHYLKFGEIAASCIYKVFGGIESGKAINYIFAFGVFGYAINVLQKLSLSFALSILLSSIAIFSPVVVAQISSFYVDGLLSCAISLALLAIVDLEIKDSTSKYALFIISLVIISSIKLSGIGYAGFIGIGYLLYKLILHGFKRSLPLIKSGFISVAFILVFNYNPLITNMLDGKHFGYPVMGEGKADIISSQLPSNFKDLDRFSKLFIATFSTTSNHAAPTQWKIPFTSSNDWNLAVDTKIAGFGYYFGGVLILCTLLVLMNLRAFYNRKLVAMLGLILGSTLLNPESWWARYAPQLWLIPVVIIIFSYNLQFKVFSRFLRILILTFLLLNITISAKHNFDDTLGYTDFISSFLDKDEIKKPMFLYFADSTEKSFAIKLLERDFEVDIIDENRYNQLRRYGIHFANIPGTLQGGILFGNKSYYKGDD